VKQIAALDLAILAAALLVAACQQLPTGETKPQPVAPQITDSVLRDRAAEQLATGVKQYDAGEYDGAVISLAASLEHGMLPKAEQARARKYLAFAHCVSGRESQCRDEFRKAFEIYPDFALSTAEDGHPIWGPVYRDVRTQLIEEREAAVAKPLVPLGKAEQMLQDGLVKYDSGEYAEANQILENALKEGLMNTADRVKAMKYLAFTLCLEKKSRACRVAFIKIHDVDPAFDLSPAEAGHPSWTKTFAAAKAQAMKELAAKEAKERAAAPLTAGVPKR
jgi:tetratricopeptide (TPR) repeat protein